MLALLAFGAPNAAATKYFDSFFGGTGTGAAAAGGLFNTPRDVAVNQPSTPAQPQDSWIYVVDQGNHRIQAFDADKQFQFAIGRNVIKPSPTGGSTDLGTVFEKCTIAQDCQAGTTGSLGGEFNTAQGIDIDQATGHFFVRERNSNARVQEFRADGTFVRAFGWDVVQPGGAGETTIQFDERQTVTLRSNGAFNFPPDVVTGGTFTLSFGTTAPTTTDPISWQATAAAVEEALEGLGDIGPGDVEVSGAPGGPWTVDFRGALAGTNVTPIAGNGAGLIDSSGTGATVVVTTNISGGPAAGFETCTVAAQCKAGTTGSFNGQFGTSTTTTDTGAIAVAPPNAPNAGEVYVGDPGNRRVQRFTVPADSTSPVVPGSPFGGADVFDANHPRHVAADSNGVVYASNAGAGASTSANGQVLRYDSAANAFRSTISPGADDAPLYRSHPNGLEIDQVSGHLLVGRNPSANFAAGSHGEGILELDVSENPETVDDSHVVDIHGLGLGITANGLAVKAGTGELFVTTTTGVPGTGAGGRVLVFDETGVDPPPTVTLLPAEDVGCTSVTLRAEINPNGPTGFPTSYRFEVSKTGLPNDWTPVGSEELVGTTGDGSAFESVEQAATGLEANTQLYRFRVRTIRSPGQPAVISPPQIFATAPCPPTAETVAGQQITDVSAQLVGRLNPGGLTTSYWFEWGDTDYGNVIPVPAGTATGATSRIVVEQLAGLDSDRHYHFRFCAQNELASAPVCGADRAFSTRAAGGPSTAGGRVYEMVSAPDKALRRGGEQAPQGVDFGGFADAVPSVTGDVVRWGVFATVVDPDSGAEASPDKVPEIRRRTPAGWVGEAILNVPARAGLSAPNWTISLSSADQRTFVWGADVGYLPFFEQEADFAVRVMGDRGGPLGAGWYRMDAGFPRLMDDNGERLLSASAPTGGTLTLSEGPGWAQPSVVSECTGAAGQDGTRLPARIGSGVFTDTIGERECQAGSATDARGADVSSADYSPLLSSVSTAMSGDGKRVFFASPDPDVRGVGQASCSTATGGATACPAQLFVRQLDGQGDATVRWISRAEDALFDMPQQIGQLGNGVAFEGASRSGDVVYFRTNAPLTTDDPNGGQDLVNGGASRSSWDLYRYELGDDLNADPAAGDPGDRLTRISAGPVASGAGDLTSGSPTVTNVTQDEVGFAVGQVVSGQGIPLGTTVTAVGVDTLTLSHGATESAVQADLVAAADPNTNCAIVATSGADAGDCSGSLTSTSGGLPMPNGEGGVIRFLSDDGQRVFFVTTAAIPGARNTPPSGGMTAPTSLDGQQNVESRNLYVYDARKTGSDAYEFIARLPFARSGSTKDVDACASSGVTRTGPAHQANPFDGHTQLHVPDLGPNCVHGSASGDAIVFETTGALTSDDVDSAVDIYLYDAAADALTRLSAPPAGQPAYVCGVNQQRAPSLYCNGDLGYMSGAFGNLVSSAGVGLGGLPHWNIAQDAQGDLTTVFFQTRTPLVADDVNGDRMDVYEWRRGSGRLSLVSPGTASESAFYTGNSLDGRDVFFWTQQRLSSWEIDAADGDVYNATTRSDRLPGRPSPPVVCDVFANGCQGDGAETVSPDSKTSRLGAGDNAEGERRKTLQFRVSRKARKRAARTGKLTIVVRASEPGRVSAVARGRLGKRLRRLARRTIDLREPGVAKLTLGLNRGARRTLRKGKSLRVTVSLTSNGARTRTRSVRLPGAPS